MMSPCCAFALSNLECLSRLSFELKPDVVCMMLGVVCMPEFIPHVVRVHRFPQCSAKGSFCYAGKRPALHFRDMASPVLSFNRNGFLAAYACQ